MAKRTPENNRRQLIEQQRKKARAKERRMTFLIIGTVSVVAIGIIGSAVYFADTGKGGAKLDLDQVGLAADAAGCDPVKDEPIPKEATEEATKHTARNGDQVQYAIAPPTSGRHNPTPLPVGSKRFYSRDENAGPERAVHNLEHGYIVVWFDKTVQGDQLKRLEEAADAANGKFLVVAWNRQDFPDNKHIVLTSWAKKQACADVSGAVMQEFMDNYGGPKSLAPEKNAL